MCVAEGMGLIPWGSLGMGQFKTEEQRKAPGRAAFFPLTENVIKVSGAVESVAKRKDTAITSIALAYVMHKTPYVFPVIGGRNIGHLKGNIEALSVELTQEDIAEIEKAVTFELGFPMDVLGTSAATSSGNLIGGQCDWVEAPKVCIPSVLGRGFAKNNLSPSHRTKSRVGTRGHQLWCSLVWKDSSPSAAHRSQSVRVAHRYFLWIRRSVSKVVRN
jgi:hypothetical protein